MRKATGLLALCGAALTAAFGAAADPTIILDTYGNGSVWNVGGTVTSAGSVGFHGAVGSVVNAPTDTQTHAAYAVLPFTVLGLPAGQSAVSSVEIVFNIQPPAGSSSNVTSLYGAIFQVPAGGAAALNTPGVTQVGASFQFNTTNAVDQSDPLHGSLLKGNGITELLPALNLAAANITLTAGQSYFLVIEPKNGLGPTANDTLLDYGLWIDQTAAKVLSANPTLTKSNNALTNSYVSVAGSEDTFIQGNNGDGLTLQSLTLGRTAQPGYFGARISVDAAQGATLTGRVSLEGVPDLSAVSPYAPLGLFHVSIRTAGTSAEIKAADVPLTVTTGSPVGTFSIPAVPAGTYDIVVKGAKNLAVLTPNVVVSGSAASFTVAAPLPAGDSNNDNIVDSSDFGTLIGAFNSDGSVPGSGYDPTVDFNFDGLVDSTDFGLLIGEFNNAGAM